MSLPSLPTAEELKAKLIEIGVSEEVAAGIVAVGEKFKSQFEAAQGDKEALMKVFLEHKAKAEEYVKTRSEADQAAYAKFVEATKAKIAARKQ